MTVAGKQAIWLKLGFWPSVLVALAPVAIALFHLMPMVPLATKPAIHHRVEQPAAPAPERHASHHHHHHGAGADEAAALAESILAVAIAMPEDSPAAVESRDEPSHHARPHCPLCLWLQGFHVLPPPDLFMLRQPRERAVAFTARETVFGIVALRATAQARAPPLPLQA